MPSAADESSRHPRPWETGNVLFAGALAYLIPGAGHLLQGRTFKGLIYCICIHGAFFTGMCLGEGMTVHYKVPAHAAGWKQISLSYVAQIGNGIWALPALAQSRRVDDRENQRVYSLPAPLSSSFRGGIEANGPGAEAYAGKLVGTITLEPSEGPLGRDVKGKFQGTQGGKPVTLELAGGFELDKPLGASPGRSVRIRIERDNDDHPNLDLVLKGTIPRSLWNWYAVPPETPQLQEITGRLGKYWELALVFTWISGLLNVLAVWDCVNGPSMGFGDERSTAKPDTDPNSGTIVGKTVAEAVLSAVPGPIKAPTREPTK